MAKINKTKEYAVKYLFTIGKQSPAAIAKELKISIDDVNRVVDNLDQTTPAKDKTKDLMIRHTAGKKTNTVSIMTESAAQLSDEFMKNINQQPKNTSGYIFRPRDNQ